MIMKKKSDRRADVQATSAKSSPKGEKETNKRISDPVTGTTKLDGPANQDGSEDIRDISDKPIDGENSLQLQEQIQLEERYGIDADTNIIQGAQVRHPNRNADKTGFNRRISVKSPAAKRKKTSTNTSVGNTVPAEEITNLNKEALLELANFGGDVCISVYMPRHQSANGLTTVVDATLFKALLQQCERTHTDGSPVELARVLRPAYDLARNDQFWRSQNGGGLAFFIADGFLKYVALPAEPETATLVNSSFLLSPLVPFVLNEEHFYLLVISKKQSKLFRGDKFGLRYVSVPEMPNGIADVVHLEEKDDQNLIRSGSSGGGSGAVYHGTGSSRPDDKENIAMYLAEVDSTIRKEVLRDSQVPLLLAGVGYLIPIYRKVTHYNNVWDTALTGNREFENDATLHAEAMEAMREYFERPKKQALADYGNRSATERTSLTIDDIVRAAYYKRIETLFVGKKARLSGSYDDVQDLLTVHASEQPGDDNLIDKTVLKTLLSGGKVYVLDEHEMPANRMMAAVMRYA